MFLTLLMALCLILLVFIVALCLSDTHTHTPTLSLNVCVRVFLASLALYQCFLSLSFARSISVCVFTFGLYTLSLTSFVPFTVVLRHSWHYSLSCHHTLLLILVSVTSCCFSSQACRWRNSREAHQGLSAQARVSFAISETTKRNCRMGTGAGLNGVLCTCV